MPLTQSLRWCIIKKNSECGDRIPVVAEFADAAKLYRTGDNLIDAAKVADNAIDAAKVADNVGDSMGDTKKVLNNIFPENDAQIKHIFRDKEGHVLDTPENRKMLSDIANNETFYKGTDRYGNRWYVVNDEAGQQVWVRVRDGKIDNAGKNKMPKSWDAETGLYDNANQPKNDFKK